VYLLLIAGTESTVPFIFYGVEMPRKKSSGDEELEPVRSEKEMEETPGYNASENGPVADEGDSVFPIEDPPAEGGERRVKRGRNPFDRNV
jgi:hypothetical protein